MITERSFPTATVMNNEIYVAGGDELNLVEKYNLVCGEVIFFGLNKHLIFLFIDSTQSLRNGMSSLQC